MMRAVRLAVVVALLVVTGVAGPACAPPAGAAGTPPVTRERAASGASAGWVRAEVGDCVLEAPADLRPLLERLAQRASLLLPRVEAELGARAAAPYRIILIPRGPLIPRGLPVPGPGSAPEPPPGPVMAPEPPPGPDLHELDALAPAWAAGFLLPARRIGAIRLSEADRYPHADLASVLAHEATHMLLFDAAGGNLPRWFGEGVATGIERSWGMRDVLVYSSSLLTGRLPPLAELDAAFDTSDDRARAAYAASFDFMLWTVRQYGSGVVRDIVRRAATRPFPEAWHAATGVALDRSEADWRRGSLLLYRWVPALTGTTALWTGITLLALLAAARRRARSRAILERWEDEDGREVPSRRDGEDDVVH
jgi:hypothetical protein